MLNLAVPQPAPETSTDPEAPSSERRIATRCGASASVRSIGDADAIEIRDREGRLVFDYQPGSGRVIVSVPEGDLTLCAPRGNIDLVSAGSIRCHGVAGVSLEAGDLAPASPALRAEEIRPSLVLEGGAAHLSARQLDLSGQRANLSFVDATYRGERLSATIDCAKVVLTRMESIAVHVLQRAKRVFRQVEDVDQLAAGRSRTIVDGDYSVKSGHASIQAEGDVKIDGKQVYLG
jgi:hypothetical protein